jgi:DNA-directed RNA polymerase sigma subunit (sigma70/sigma32)
MNSADNAERDAAICARRDAGLTYTAIAGQFGISRERVRQIVDAWKRKRRRNDSLAPVRAAFERGRRYLESR